MGTAVMRMQQQWARAWAGLAGLGKVLARQTGRGHQQDWKPDAPGCDDSTVTGGPS